MKFLYALSASLLLALGGCATAPGQAPMPAASSAEAVGTSPTGASAPAPSRATVLIQGGPLTPITSGQAHGQAVTTIAPPRDLWERIRRGFAIPDLDSDLVRDREQWYATRPDYMSRMAERSSKYLFHIVEELERRNMPSELALLPFIESAFNPQAVSSAKAAGMWQFVPATGKDFALKQNMFRDDRRDVLASTRAALDYLQKLYAMFGDWQLALAAYNWGEGSVGRAIAKNQRAGLPTTYSDLSMPAETRLYIPKLQAVKNLVRSPESMHVSLPDIANHPYFQQVPITRDIDVALAAKLARVNIDDFKALNPSANRPVILASGTPQILLPWDNATIFDMAMESYKGEQLATWTAWTAPHTMTPAEAARLTGMKEMELRQVNQVPPRMLVKSGSTLLVPRSQGKTEDVAMHVADNAQLNLSPEVTLRELHIRALKGDTVAAVAKRHKLDAGKVAEWNHISAKASLKPGQQLVLFLPPTPNKVATSARPAPVRTAMASKPAPHPVRLAKR